MMVSYTVGPQGLSLTIDAQTWVFHREHPDFEEIVTALRTRELNDARLLLDPEWRRVVEHLLAEDWVAQPEPEPQDIQVFEPDAGLPWRLDD